MSAAQKNDVNVIFDGWKNAGNLDMEAYGFSVRDMDESQCVAELMKLYRRLAQA